MKGLEKFVSEHVLTTLSTPEKQRIDEVIKSLEDRYRLDKIQRG